ncbi:hypothetical protein [Parapedobacter sp. DT-150]|uniref:hypothetical protein n=1 Tax=Parapedobacter sp. DT-150 TaxID=3396162 RepID=UPI003F1AFBAD
MKTRILPHFVVLFLTLATSACKKNDRLTFDEPMISLRTYVGWCAPNDSLTIGKDHSLWIHYASCNDEVGVKKQWATESTDHEELLELLSTGDFTALDMNECGACYDGTTYTVTVRDGNRKHSISLEGIHSTGGQTQNGMPGKLLAKLLSIIEKQAEKQ